MAEMAAVEALKEEKTEKEVRKYYVGCQNVGG